MARALAQPIGKISRPPLRTTLTPASSCASMMHSLSCAAVGKIQAVNVPADLLYTSTHEWVRMDGDIATIGITDHAQSELGDIVFVELPSPGRVLRASDSFGSVESVKTVSDVYAPVAGEVTEINGALGAQSELMNSDPFGAGWLVKIRVSEPVEGLLDATAYTASIAH